jgi:hypothetical protein
MKHYVKPLDCPKEHWIGKYGSFVANPFDPVPLGNHLVCLVATGPTNFIGIIFDDDERNIFAFSEPRPKSWFQVADKSLVAVCPACRPDLQPLTTYDQSLYYQKAQFYEFGQSE